MTDVPIRLPSFSTGSCIELHRSKRFGETCTEVEALVACPTVRVTVTLHRYRIDGFYVRIIGKIPIHGFPQIQENGSIGFWGKYTAECHNARWPSTLHLYYNLSDAPDNIQRLPTLPNERTKSECRAELPPPYKAMSPA